MPDWTNPAPTPTPTPTPSRNGITARTGHTFDGLAGRPETSQAYLDERRDVLPVFTDRHKLSAENASSIAQSMVKVGYTLNGGALVAIPTIIGLFHLAAQKAFWPFMSSGIGILFNSAGIFLLYGSEVFASKFWWEQAIVRSREIEIKHGRPGGRRLRAQMREARQNRDRYKLWNTQLSRLGFASMVMSLGCFLLCAFLIAIAMRDAALARQELPQTVVFLRRWVALI